jgi:hypothetical protein
MTYLRVAALWAIGAALLASSAWVTWSYANFTVTLYSDVNGVTATDADYRWSQVFSSLPVPLMVGGFFAIMMALVVHAALWRRARTTPTGT